jgi:hypothetical protein
MTLDDFICDYYLDLTPTGAEPTYLPCMDVEEVQNVTPGISLDFKRVLLNLPDDGLLDESRITDRKGITVHLMLLHFR